MNQAKFNPDPIALEVAGNLHGTRRPMATILFGSRARGDHRPDSDIDIMLVEEQPPAETDQRQIQQAFTEQTQERHGHEAGVHLVWVTPDVLEADGRYVNSLTGQALLEGRVFSDAPDRFRSRYAGPDAPAPEYDWSNYQYILEVSLNCAKLTRLIAARLREDAETAGSIRLRHPWSYFALREGLGWPEAKQYAASGMHHGLEAAMLGAGRIAKTGESTAALAEKLHAILQGSPWTHIPLEHYASGEAPAGMSDQEFVDIALTDLESTRKLAMRLRRQTGGRKTSAARA